MTTFDTERLAHGMDVYDSNDDKIGSVEDVYDAPPNTSRTSTSTTSTSGGGYLRVPTGFLGLGPEHHIPFSAISHVEADKVYLRVPREQLDELGYAEAPTRYAAPEDAALLEAEPDMTTERTMPAAPRSVTASDADVREVDGVRRDRMQLREEELIPRKRRVETGRVRLETNVVSEERSVEVPLTREEVYVERHAVDGRPSDEPMAESGRTIEVAVHEDQVTLEKRATVYEEVEVGTRAVQETQSVTGTIRREELDVQREGDIPGDVERRRSDTRLERDEDRPKP